MVRNDGTSIYYANMNANDHRVSLSLVILCD